MTSVRRNQQKLTGESTPTVGRNSIALTMNW
jgi:hypothetical protein